MYIRHSHKQRPSRLAVAIFAVGAGLGWHFANLLFARENPAPIAAAVRFEDAQADAIPAPQRHEVVRHEAVPTPSVPTQIEDRRAYQPDMAVRPADEERRLAEALQWAERYRQRQDASVQGVIARQVQDEKVRLAAAEAQRWAEVAANANRVKQGPVEIRKLVAAQGQQHGTRNAAASTRIASAAGAIGGAAAGAKLEPLVTRARLVPCEHCRRGRTHANGVRKPRVAAYNRRVHRLDYVLDELFCPFRWLEAALIGERHGVRGHPRRHMWLG